MLSELLTTETVQVLPEVADWRAGITEAAKPLLKMAVLRKSTLMR